jgi:hypothetical protein
MCKNEAEWSETFYNFTRSKQNDVFISNCVEEEKRKNDASFFGGKKAKKNEYNRS